MGSVRYNHLRISSAETHLRGPVLECVCESNKGMFMKPKVLVLFAVAATFGASTPTFAVVPYLPPMLPNYPTAIPVAATKADVGGAEKSAKAAQAAISASRGDQAA